MQFDPARLHAALALVPPGAWSLPSRFADTRVHHGYRQVRVVEAGRRLAPATWFAWVLDELDPVWGSWLSWIEPGGFIVPHRDAGPWRERWQVPIRATSSGRDVGAAHPQDGVAFQVRHWEPHAVTNHGDAPRVHLVVDRDVWVPGVEPAPFEVFDVPDDLRPAVAAAGG